MLGAVDVGGTKIAAGIVDENGALICSRTCDTGAGRGYDDALARIVEMLRGCVQDSGADLKGIGIGCTGPVDPVAGIIGDVDFLPGWQGANLVADLSEVFGVSIAMENDADAAALGEARWGAGRGKERFIYVTVGTGIGGGIIFSGRLYRGAAGTHPEIGHHVIDPSGPRCFCGARGCWEVLARGPAMAEWVAAQAPPGWPHVDGLTGKRVCELSLGGDDLARKAVRRESYYLGLGVANLITLFAPDVIVLGGRVMESAPQFWSGIQDIVSGSCGLVPSQNTLITVASLGSSGPLVGAAQVWSHRFSIERQEV